MNRRLPSSTLWDTVVDLAAGDAVMIWGAKFNVTFANNKRTAGYPGPTLGDTTPSEINVSIIRSGQGGTSLDEQTQKDTLDFNASGDGGDTFWLGLSEPPTQYLTSTKAASRVIVPYSITLTPRVLLAALLKLPTMDIENTIEDLIEELNIRCGNADNEPEPEEPEAPTPKRPTMRRLISVSVSQASCRS